MVPQDMTRPEGSLAFRPGSIPRHRAPIGARLFLLLAFVCLPAIAWGQSHTPAAPEPELAWQWESNPFSGDPARMTEGRRIFRRTCILCHGNRGGRGPNLKQSKLAGQAFLKVVMIGRKGTQMPAWRSKLSEEQVWTIMAYLGH